MSSKSYLLELLQIAAAFSNINFHHIRVGSSYSLISFYTLLTGGRRCTVEGCNKGARDKHFCAGHGGGKRCSVTLCNKSAVGGSGHCCVHGGGKYVPYCTFMHTMSMQMYE
jgi:hypothetical protein